MVRMSDILKRAKERAKEKEGEAKEQKKERNLSEPVQQQALPEPVKQITPPETEVHEARGAEAKEQKEEKAETSEVRISRLVMKGTKAPSNEECLKLYEDTLSLAREVLKENVDYESIDIERICVQVEKMLEYLSLNDQNLLKLAYIKGISDKDCFFRHSVNVCIYSIVMGLGLGYDKSRLALLGKLSLLHDVGMTKYMHLANQPRKLTVREYNELKNHPIKGAEILEKVKNLEKIAIYVAHQEHERIDGSGYPRGLTEESINGYALIVGMVDVYEALLHPRSYRKEFTPLEALQLLLTNKRQFKYSLIKTLIERIGVFPVGCFVELNTKEIGQVTRVNRLAPLRPVVEIISNPSGKELTETKNIDLVSCPTVCIRKTLIKSELETLPSYIDKK